MARLVDHSAVWQVKIGWFCTAGWPLCNFGGLLMDTALIRGELDELQNRFPFPPGEIRRINSRKWILDFVPKRSTGAEIGVFRGHFSEHICDIVKPRKLYLIDPWTTIGEFFGWGGDYTANDTLPTSVARDEARLRSALFPETETVIVEGMFPACADALEEPLDWIYLDASHKYEPTLAELRAIVKFLKPGGLILGDDWSADPYHVHHGVMRACHTFLRETSFDIVAAGRVGSGACVRLK